MDPAGINRNASFLDVIMDRHSSRAFRSEPVPKDALQKVIEAAIRAPSWSNTQPWEFTVVGGRHMERLKEAFVEKVRAGVPPNPDIPFPEFSEKYVDRRVRNGRRLFAELGIAREDKAKRAEHNLNMYQFFGAPDGIIVHIDRELGPYSILDVGLAIENLLLAAHCLGLGTCPMAMAAAYPDVLREILSIPASKKIICGIAIGYADEDSPAARFRSEREPFETFVTWRRDG